MIQSDHKTQQTAGQIYAQLQEKRQDKVSVFEMQEAMQEDYIPKLVDLVNKDKHKTSGDLFVEVVTKRDPIMPKMVGNWFKSRYTCPTPNFDQSVFHYRRATDSIHYLWTLPDAQSCYFLLKNALNLLPDDKALLKYVLDYRDGTLLRLAKHLNNEKEDHNLVFSLKDTNGTTITS